MLWVQEQEIWNKCIKIRLPKSLLKYYLQIVNLLKDFSFLKREERVTLQKPLFKKNKKMKKIMKQINLIKKMTKHLWRKKSCSKMIFSKSKVFQKEHHLTMDNEEIYLNILGSSHFPNLDKLFEYIQQQEHVICNFTSAAYFAKIVVSLINQNPDAILSYIYSKGEILNFLIEHSLYNSFNDILQKVLNFQKQKSNTNFECKFLKHRYILYQKLLAKILHQDSTSNPGIVKIFISLFIDEDIIDSEYFTEKLFQDSDIFKKLFRKIIEKEDCSLLELAKILIEKTFSKPKEVQPLQKFISQDFNESFKNKSDEKFDQCERVFFCKITEEDAKELLSPVNSDQESDTDQQRNSQVQNLEFPEYDPENMRFQEIQDILEKDLFYLKAKMFESSKCSELQSDGTMRKKCGKFRILLLQLLQQISNIKESQIQITLVENQFMDKMTDLLYEFPQNNLLHSHIIETLKNLLSYLFTNIDRTSSEYELASFLEYLSQFFYEKNKDELHQSDCLYRGQFDELCYFIQENYMKVQVVFDDDNWMKLQQDYVNQKFIHRNDFLYEDPAFRKESSISEINDDFLIKATEIEQLKSKKKSEAQKLQETKQFWSGQELNQILSNIKNNSEVIEYSSDEDFIGSDEEDEYEFDVEYQRKNSKGSFEDLNLLEKKEKLELEEKEYKKMHISDEKQLQCDEIDVQESNFSDMYYWKINPQFDVNELLKNM